VKTRWRLGTVLGLVLTVLVTLSGVAAADTGGPPVAANASAWIHRSGSDGGLVRFG